MRCTQTLITILILVTCLTFAYADVTVEGDANPLPTDAFWTTGGSSTTDVTIGQTGTGSLLLDGANGLDSLDARIGLESGSTGTVTVGGEGALWDVDHSLYVGKAGDGVLNIVDGGQVDSGLFLLDYRTGRIEDHPSYVGDAAGSTGAVTVDGVGSTWTDDFVVYLGHNGEGSLNVTNGGLADLDQLYMGKWSGSVGTVVVEGDGSKLVSQVGSVRVGHEGDGVFRILAGGEASCGNGVIGYNSGSTGVVTVEGNGSVWNADHDIYVGWDGNGTLDITDGGAAVVGGTTWLDWGGSGELSDRIHFDNGTLTTGSFAYSDEANITGVGTINTSGLISDGDWVFDVTCPCFLVQFQ